MMNAFYCVLFFILGDINVNCMVLKGPVLTRYDPCGLGILFFDKITDNVWKGVIYLDSYTKLKDFNISVTFENPVTINTFIRNYRQSEGKLDHKFVIKAKYEAPKIYVFYLTQNYTSVPLVKSVLLNGITMCNETTKASHTLQSSNDTKNTNGYEHVCGRRSSAHTEVISMRTEAKAGDWPWHVAIFIKNFTTIEMIYECGGSIISRVAVVTAGHCVSKNGVTYEPDRVVVIAGTSNLKEDQVGRQTLTAEKIILHPSYSDPVATADLAVIRIKRLVYSDHVQPICIWGPVYDKTPLFGIQGIIVGFGKTEYNKFSDVLRSSYIMIQNDSVCIDSSPKIYKPLMNEFTLCAGYGPTSGINPHNGDSGGGLILPVIQPDHKISWFLRGTFSKCGISADRPGCNPKFYVVYTDVAPYYGWLYHHSGLQYKSNIV